MADPRSALTPDALAMLQSIAESGSFAAAARALDLVPSSLTYRVRQIEDALDVLLFDRRSRQARLTPAGAELLREGARLLEEVDAVANRVKRVGSTTDDFGRQHRVATGDDGAVPGISGTGTAHPAAPAP